MATIVSRRRRMRMTTTRIPPPPTPRSDVRIDVVTIFPAFFDVLEVSLLGRARDAGILDVRVHDIFEEDDRVGVHPPELAHGDGLAVPRRRFRHLKREDSSGHETAVGIVGVELELEGALQAMGLHETPDAQLGARWSCSSHLSRPRHRHARVRRRPGPTRASAGPWPCVRRARSPDLDHRGARAPRARRLAATKRNG